MSPGPRAVLTALLPLLVVAVAATGAVAQAPGGGAPQIDAGTAQANTTMAVELRADGDARWHVSTTFDLATEDETAAYRELAAAFAEGDGPSLGLEAYRRASTVASAETGREMTITDVRRRTAPDSLVANGTGRLTVSFTWTNFGRVDGDRLRIGDAFEGGWLSGLDVGQTLVVRAPDGFSVFDSEVPPENGTLRWTGPRDLSPETLAATFTGSGSNGSPTPGQPGDSLSMLWVVLLTVGLGGGGLAVYLFTRRSESGSPAPATEPATDDGSRASGDGAAETPDASEPDTPTGADAAVDEELLSDEERVEHLLERNGGRMKQATIVKETGWSNAKVSQLLSSMAEEGRIDKLRIGRENLISFPEEDVTDLEE